MDTDNAPVTLQVRTHIQSDDLPHTVGMLKSVEFIMTSLVQRYVAL